jgi:sugar lactone lactonase YvrE
MVRRPAALVACGARQRRMQGIDQSKAVAIPLIVAGCPSGYSRRRRSPTDSVQLSAPPQRFRGEPAMPILKEIDRFVAVASTAAAFMVAPAALAQDLRVAKGLAMPESVLVGAGGRIYVTEIGEFGKPGDGKVTVIDDAGKLQPFAQGLDDPKGMARWQDTIYVADNTRVVRIDASGKSTVWVQAADFPQPPLFLNDITVDAKGNVYVSDSGDIQNGGKGAIFRISPEGKVTLVLSEAENAAIKSPNGLIFDRSGKLLVVDFATGQLSRVDVDSKKVEPIADGFGGGDGLAFDEAGLLYVSDWKGGRVWQVDPGKSDRKPRLYPQTFAAAADIAMSADGKFVLVPDMKAGAVYWLPK